MVRTFHVTWSPLNLIPLRAPSIAQGNISPKPHSLFQLPCPYPCLTSCLLRRMASPSFQLTRTPPAPSATQSHSLIKSSRAPRKPCRSLHLLLPYKLTISDQLPLVQSPVFINQTIWLRYHFLFIIFLLLMDYICLARYLFSHTFLVAHTFQLPSVIQSNF
jgi:hypothetical protein